MDDPDPSTRAAELRRYLRNASVLLASAERPVSADQHAHSLRLARHWVSAALGGIEQLWRRLEGVPSSVEEPLTGPVEQVTIPIRR